MNAKNPSTESPRLILAKEAFDAVIFDLDGVADFLQSRGIDLPYGDTGDPLELESVCGLGNRKNRLYLEKLKQGVEVYESTVDLIHQLLAHGANLLLQSVYLLLLAEHCAVERIEKILRQAHLGLEFV